jgi:ribonuclease R
VNRKPAAKSKQKPARPALPSEAQILEFIAASPGKVGKREIARAFDIRGDQRAALKDLLKQMAADGKLERRSRRLDRPGSLPPVAVIEVTGTDSDGELIAEPVEWDSANGKPPRILLAGRQALGARIELQPPAKGDRLLAKITPGRDTDYPYSAAVIRKLSSRANRVIGVFRTSKTDGFRIVPADKKARAELRVRPGDDHGARPGELVEAELVQDRGRGLLSARVRRRLGAADDQRNISLIAIHQHAIPDQFPPAVLAEAARLAPASRSGRRDLTKLPLVTIDPPDARDHDDAVHAEPDDDPGNRGGFRITVAIADVAAYVHPGTALDREARIRGNSVYFPDRVVPMLPERISNDLCSLREGEERPAFACFMLFDARGNKLKHRFERVIMRSAAKLSYEEAQGAIDGRPIARTNALLEPVLRPLWAAYAALEAARRRRSPLELDVPERRLILDAHGLIERVVTPERLTSHRLVEEFMIAANVAAAETLTEHKMPLLFRIHEPPSQEKVRALADFLATIGIDLPKGQVMKPQHFNRILERVAGSDEQHIVNEVVLRTQAQAVYSPDNLGHFGLNLRRYAHFTSPIRRYADLIVHRALISALGLGDDGLSPQDIDRLGETADIISAAERRAMAAERDTVDRMIAKHLASEVGAVFAAKISGVTRAGLFVSLNDSGADGFVPVASLETDYFHHEESMRALVGARTGETFRLGDSVEVRLVEATPVAGGLRFAMVSAGRKGAAPGRKGRPSNRSGGPRKRR